MDLIEEMWISRPEKRMTKLSDLSDGVIARIKFYNANHYCPKKFSWTYFKLLNINVLRDYIFFEI